MSDVNEVVAACDVGHQFTLKDFEPFDQVIASISWCPSMVAKKEYGGLILECGSRVLWLKTLPVDKPKKRVRFRVMQLDLFDDKLENVVVEVEKPLDKAKIEC